MDITVFLAQLWGPTILAAGIGFFTSRSYYVKLYRDLDKNALTVLVLGMLAMAAGIAQVSVHSVWSTIPEIVVSLLGWALLVKGVAFVIAPGFVNKASDAWAKMKLVTVSGALMLIIGAYLSWFGYFA